MPTRYRTSKMRTTGGHRVTVQGKPYNIHVARMVFRCIHCLSELKIKNTGLKCSCNENHYGFIHQNEASRLTTEERFMKISDMFPSEYLRGVDITNSRRMKIKKVETVLVKNRNTGKMENENLLYFEGESKKLRLNITMTKEVHFEILNLSPDDEPHDNWPGHYVTVYQIQTKDFGKTQIVPRIRKPKSGDQIWPPINGKEKPLHKLNRKEFWSRVKRDLGLPVEVSKFILIQEGLNGEYKAENAQKMWQVLGDIGEHLNKFLDAALVDVPYFTTKSAILDVLAEWKAVYQFEEQIEMELVAALETYAKSKADEDLTSADQLGFDAPAEPQGAGAYDTEG